VVARSSVIKPPLEDKVFDAVNTVLLGLAFLVFTYPLVFVISASLSSTAAVVSGRVWLWPVDVTIDGYRAVLEYDGIWMGYRNSLFYAAAGTAISVILTVMIAYPLSRPDVRGRNLVTFLFAFTMMFRGGLIPEYLVVRELGMLDTIWAILIPNALIVFNIIITRTFFQVNIPKELLEAARLDGASDFQFLLRVVLPLSKAIIAVIALFYAVSQWNMYFQALIYLSSERLFPLQIFLRDALIQNESLIQGMDVEDQIRLQNLQELMRYAIIIVATVPVLLIYPFVQKYFVRGVMIGAIKG
jgi:multiple sugar transport system permease protein/putative aldouronate transport system permease protein